MGQKIRVLIVGSSNAAGAGASSTTTSWGGRLAAQYAATHDFVNVAIGGKSIQYWVDQNKDGLVPIAGEACALEYHIRKQRPDIVIGSFTMQNGWSAGGDDYLRCVRKAAYIAHRYGAKYVGITPYMSNGYTSADRAINRYCADSVTRMGFPVIDFQSVWEVPDGESIPAIIDIGDGLHVNDVGHYEQWAAIPPAVMTPVRDKIPDRLVSSLGMTIPNDTTTMSVIGGVNPGPGSWTFGFFQKLPTSMPATSLASLHLPVAANTRLRAPGITRFEIADTASRIVALRDNIFDGRVQHWMMSYNKSRNRMRLYQDGDLCGEYQPDPSYSFNGPISFGGRSDTGAFNNVGFGYYCFTLQQSEIHPREAYLAARGVYVNRSLSLVSPMDDCALVGGKAAGERIATAYGSGQALVTGVAL